MEQEPAGTEWFVHATAVVVGEAGVLIRGASGAGKSSLALALLASEAAPARHVSLIGDDRVRLTLMHGRLVARAHPAIAGRIEQRGEGLLNLAYEPAAVIRCTVDICPLEPGCDIPPRSPADDERTTAIGGVTLPRLALRKEISPQEAARRVASFLARL